MSTDFPPPHPAPPPERRGLARARTFREILISSWAGRPRWGRGTAVDVSPNGLRIHTNFRVSPGEPIEIELPPKPGASSGALTRAKGEVVWTAPRDAGEWALGVQLDSRMFATIGDPLSNRGDAASAMAEVRQQFKTIERAAPHPDVAGDPPGNLLLSGGHRADNVRKILEGEAAPEAPEHVAFRPVSRRRDMHRRIAAAMAAVLILGFVVWMLGYWDAPTRPAIIWEGGPGPGMRTVYDRGPDEPALAAIRKSRKTGNGGRHAADLRKRAPELPNAELLYYAQAGLAEGESAVSRVALDALLMRPHLPPVDRFAGRMALAAAQQQDNQPAAALNTILVTLRDVKGVPPPWISRAEKYRKLLAAGMTKDLAPLLFRKAIEIAPWDPPAAESSATPAAEAGPDSKTARTAVRIEISVSRYTLNVFDAEENLGEFPVGLGQGNSTPLGKFRIANKIINPDWYHRGQTIQAGAPENPLGNRWMGLAGRKGPIPYGIHPTNEPDSIGHNQSQGCIRMLPDDAEQVFAWCDIGTPVTIGP